MSLFGGFPDVDDDDIFGSHFRSMNQHMNQMNRLMGSMMGGFGMGGGMMDPFNMMPSLGAPGLHQSLVHRGANSPGNFLMPRNNVQIQTFLDDDAVSNSFCQTSFTSMRTGPDGRPQVYQETSSVQGRPGGVKETRKTVQDSHRGIKKMAIGHHIGERAHIIEKEQNTRSGHMEERQDFINLDEDEAEQFDKEFQTKVRSKSRYSDGQQMARITEVGEDYPSSNQILRALPAPPSSSSPNSQATSSNRSTQSKSDTDKIGNQKQHRSSASRNSLHPTPRKPLRTPSTSSPVALNSTPSVHPHPYNSSAARKNHRSKHSKSRVVEEAAPIVEFPDDD